MSDDAMRQDVWRENPDSEYVNSEDIVPGDMLFWYGKVTLVLSVKVGENEIEYRCLAGNELRKPLILLPGMVYERVKP